MFGDLKNTSGEEIIENGDRLGGGGLFDSGIYEFDIVAAYGGKAQSGARSVTVEAKDPVSGRSFKTTQWVTSGDAKGGKNTYKDKDGNLHYLPGYELINAIALMAAGKELPDLVAENKILKIYDYTAKAEVPQEVPVLVELTGKKLYLGILKQEVNKQAKDDAGVYQDTAETREQNELAHVFHYPSKRTVAEAKAKAESEFYAKWEEKNKGKTQNKVKAVTGGTQGKPARSAGGATDGGGKPASLFG